MANYLILGFLVIANVGLTAFNGVTGGNPWLMAFNGFCAGWGAAFIHAWITQERI